MKKLFIVLATMLLMVITGCTPGGWGNTPASSAKAITAFSLNGVAGTIDETAKTIFIVMPSGTDLNGLIATFTTTGASVTVNSTVQTSGTTPNDFTHPVTYTVTAADASTAIYTVTVATASYPSFILSNEGGGLINELVANGYGDYNLYDAFVAIQQSTTPSVAPVITDQFLAVLASCPADSAIFTTHLRDYMDSTPQSVTEVPAVSKSAVMRAGVSINVDQETFILSNEGGGLISQMVAAGYGTLNLYQSLQQLVLDTNPSIAGFVTPEFLLALHNCPADSDIFTHTLSEYTGAGVAVAINTDGTVQTVSVYGRTYLGTTGTATLKSNISGVGDGLFTHTTTSSPLTSWTVTGPLAGMTTTYNVFAIGWAPSTTASLAISTDCTVQAVNIHGSTYYGKTGTATLNSSISGVGNADFTYTTNLISPLIRWIVTGKEYDAFAIGWVPATK